jgi:hypothetical protein
LDRPGDLDAAVDIVETDDVDIDDPERDRFRSGFPSSPSLDRLRPLSSAFCASTSSATPFLDVIVSDRALWRFNECILLAKEVVWYVTVEFG